MATSAFTLSWISRPVFAAGSAPGEQPVPQRGPGPEPVPDPQSKPPQFPAWGIALLVIGGVLAGLGIYQAVSGQAPQPTATQPTLTSTVAAERSTFEKSIRIGGTVGATNFAMIRAPRMRGGRDRGGGSGLTIQTLAEAGTVVQAGEVVAEFESKSTQDQMDTYASMLAQTRAQTATRKAEMLIATETLRQNYRTTKAEAEKAAFDLQTAEVRSAIQAEIFKLLAEEGTASSEQLEQEVRLQELADAAEQRSLDITVEQDHKRLERTEFDFEKMKLRTPVGGLVVIETMFSRGSFQQASPGDQVYGGAYFMRIVDLSSMAVYAELNQADSQIIELGAPVIVRLDAYPDAEFEGRIKNVGAMATSSGSSGGRRGPPGSSGSRGDWIKKVSVLVEIVDSDQRIQPDLSASVDVIVDKQEDVLVIPRAAIAEIDGAPVVWVEDDRAFEMRQVQLGSVSDTQAVVVSGLSEGEMIAAQPIEAPTQLAQR
ncbi:MAG: efflux RND transporter periplasmic adaptor subunit [Bryobacterales bacterium]|nr:efflux RND transporter periplasmic adaptor subunit [Bryobacterales bacterium]MDE0620848.1 efflux RND transporter periplasmic adaptor subunit [Bryobacterales bacterium]